MTDIATDPKHFTKAVTELGEKRPVVTTQAIFNDRGVKIIEKGVQVNVGLYERLMAHKLTVPIEQSVASAPVRLADRNGPAHGPKCAAPGKRGWTGWTHWWPASTALRPRNCATLNSL